MDDSYSLQRAVFDLVRRHEGAVVDERNIDALGEPEHLAVKTADLTALARFGVHPVLLHALARATGRTRDEYRELLRGIGTRPRGRARWHVS